MAEFGNDSNQAKHLKTDDSKLLKPTTLPELPIVLQENILRRLTVVDKVKNASGVSMIWWDLLKDPTFWTTIDMRDNDNISDEEMVGICTYAISKSSTTLQHIYIDNFATNQLLIHLAHSTDCLRTLHLTNCWGYQAHSLLQVVIGNPMLHDINLTIGNLSSTQLEFIGFNCPKLKSLAIHIHLLHADNGFNDHAIAIGKSMMEFQHLKISANILSNVGVRHIVKGCKYLDTLDLLGCQQLILTPYWRDKCHETVKNLSLPPDDEDERDFLHPMDDFIDYGSE